MWKKFEWTFYIIYLVLMIITCLQMITVTKILLVHHDMHVQATEQFEPLDNVQQNSACIPQNVQATERFEPPNNIQQDFTSTPQRVQATENVEPLDNFEQPFTGIPQSVQVTDQPAVEDNEPRHKQSKVTVSITSLLYISIFVFAPS